MADESKQSWTWVLLNSQLFVIALGVFAWLAGSAVERLYLLVYGIPPGLIAAFDDPGVRVYNLLLALALAAAVVVLTVLPIWVLGARGVVAFSRGRLEAVRWYAPRPLGRLALTGVIAATVIGLAPIINLHSCVQDLLGYEPAVLFRIMGQPAASAPELLPRATDPGQRVPSGLAALDPDGLATEPAGCEFAFTFGLPLAFDGDAGAMDRALLLALHIAALVVIGLALRRIRLAKQGALRVRPLVRVGSVCLLLLGVILSLPRSYALVYEAARYVPEVTVRLTSPSGPPEMAEGALLASSGDRLLLYATGQERGLRLWQRAEDQQQTIAMTGRGGARGRSLLSVHLSSGSDAMQATPSLQSQLLFLGLPWSALTLAAMIALLQPASAPAQEARPATSTDQPAVILVPATVLSYFSYAADSVIQGIFRAFRLRGSGGKGTEPPVSGGNLWRYDLADRTLARLTEGGGFTSPRPSLDGRHILALKGDRPIVLDADGTLVRSMPTAQIDRLLGWDESGNKALAETVRGDLVVVDLATGGLTPAAGAPELTREDVRNLARMTPRLTLLQTVSLGSATEVNETPTLAETPRFLFEVEGRVFDPVMLPDQTAVLFAAPGS